ncbi:hypothetical protein KAH81_06355 [bacterium]|nr:hypothetical protein [bacterium]
MAMHQEIGSRFSQYSRLLLRRRRLFYLVVVLPLIFTIVFTEIATPTFEAQGKLLPSSDSSNMGVIGILTGFFGSQGTQSQDGAPSSFLYVDILRSRAVIDKVIEEEVRFQDGHNKWREGKLRELLGYKRGSLGVEDFLNSSNAKSDLENGIITLRVQAKDPYLAALLLNTWIEKLDEFNKHVRITQAGESIKYLEKRLVESNATLQAASDSLINFLEDNRGYPNASTPKVEASVRRLTNDRDIKEQVNSLLIQEYEMANLTKQKTTPVVSVLDYAKPPDEKAGPKRIPVFMASLIFALLILFLALSILEAKDPTPSDQFVYRDEVKAAIKMDWRDLKGIFRRKC